MESQSMHKTHIDRYQSYLKDKYAESLDAMARDHLKKSYQRQQKDFVHERNQTQHHKTDAHLQQQVQTLANSQNESRDIIHQLSLQIIDLQSQVSSEMQVQGKTYSDDYVAAMHGDLEHMLTLHERSSNRIDYLENELNVLRSIMPEAGTRAHDLKLATIQEDLQGINNFRNEFSKNVVMLQNNMEMLHKKSCGVQQDQNMHMNKLFLAITNMQSQTNVNFGELYGDIVQCVGIDDPASLHHIREAAKAKMHHHLSRQ